MPLWYAWRGGMWTYQKLGTYDTCDDRWRGGTPYCTGRLIVYDENRKKMLLQCNQCECNYNLYIITDRSINRNCHECRTAFLSIQWHQNRIWGMDIKSIAIEENISYTLIIEKITYWNTTTLLLYQCALCIKLRYQALGTRQFHVILPFGVKGNQPRCGICLGLKVVWWEHKYSAAIGYFSRNQFHT